MAYRLIPGGPLSRHILLAETAVRQATLLKQLGRFLRELHALPVSLDPGAAPGHVPSDAREKTRRLYAAMTTELFPLMMAHARDWAEQHFRPALEGRLDLTYSPALVHGDLMPYHLCYDSASHALTGVIDFGEAGAGDAAADLGSLIIAYGERLVRQMQPAYPALESLMERARFYAGQLELTWALQAVRTRDPAWFLCHLGYARDAGPALTPSSSWPSS